MLRCHKHPLYYRPPIGPGWGCDGANYFGTCESGMDGYRQDKDTYDIDSWRCNKCDYDICRTCA